MNAVRLSCLVLIIGLTCFTLALADGASKPAPELVIRPADINAATDEEFDTQLTAMRQGRDRLVADALSKLRDPKLGVVQRGRAIRLVGVLRAPEAIDPLIENIGFRSRQMDPVVISGPDMNLRYPAIGALAEIGEPSVMPMLEAVRDGSIARGDDRFVAMTLDRIFTLEQARQRVLTFSKSVDDRETRNRLIALANRFVLPAEE